MPKDYPRNRRVGDEIQRELSELIRREVDDPRADGANVVEVRVSRDLGHARVFFTHLDPNADTDAVAQALNGAAGFLRSQLAKRMRIRTVPALKFEYDESLDRGLYMDRLIADARKRDSDAGGTAEGEVDEGST